MWKVSTAVAGKRGRSRGSTPLERSWELAANSSRSGLLSSGLPTAPHSLHGLPPDSQPHADLSMAAQALEVFCYAHGFNGLTWISRMIF